MAPTITGTGGGVIISYFGGLFGIQDFVPVFFFENSLL